MTDWIPASDPPSTAIDILFANLDGALFAGYYDGKFEEFIDNTGQPREAVAWWMPIPPLPDNSPGWRHMW